MAYCSQYCTQRCSFLTHTCIYTHTQVLFLYIAENLKKKTCILQDATCRTGICILNASALFVLSVCWLFGSVFTFSMNHFNSLQSASRGHSQHSVPTDGTHSHMESHTNDSCPLLGEGKVGPVSARSRSRRNSSGIHGTKY